MTLVPEPRITVLPVADEEAGGLVADVRRGLDGQPRRLAPKWLYDDHGSALFAQITRLPEYYPFAREHEILRAHADEIAAASGADTVIELGSGTSEKTRLLLDAFAASGRLARFCPVDVSATSLREAVAGIAQRYPGDTVDGIVGDFTRHLAHLPQGGRRMVAFLGGTIGNLYDKERGAFLRELAAQVAPGDSLLLGTDLVKDIDRLIAAYHDPGGVTADFIGNGLRVLNRELGADFDLGAFTYVPFWDAARDRMDLRLRADSAQRVCIPGAGLTLVLAAGEEIQVEISTKFRPSRLGEELAAAGLPVARTWTDPAGDFAVTLAVKE